MDWPPRAAGTPHHRLAGTPLNGADLRGWRIGADDGQPLNLRHISFAGADLSNAVLDRVDLRDADLTGAVLTRAEVLDSDLRGAGLSEARLTGTVLRDCALDGARWDGSTAYRAQALRCRPTNGPDRAGWLVTPDPGANIEQARCTSFTGHTGWVVGGVFSPDGARVLATSGDGTARIWDAASGEQIPWQLEQLPGGKSPSGLCRITACSASPPVSGAGSAGSYPSTVSSPAPGGDLRRPPPAHRAGSPGRADFPAPRLSNPRG
ncbi:MAG TPA: pentapeptide repeat-containing protein [Pseudonocardiaceae bacterium]|nr:pentapeptide repeat-containing protein [Pseudonocardiaceae bacterium]